MAPPRRVYHGTPALLAPAIHRRGLQPKPDFVHLAETVGLAWAFGAWATGLLMSEGMTGTLRVVQQMASVGSEAESIERLVDSAVRSDGPNLAAVCEVDVQGLALEEVRQMACPVLPWESQARQAPVYRTAEAIGCERIVRWQFFRVPELNEPGVLDVLSGRSLRLAHDYPRGARILEDLSAGPIGTAIPNGRRLVATILDHAGPAAELQWHGAPHWVRVARWGQRLIAAEAEVEPAVVLLFSLLHDAARQQDGHDPEHGPRAAQLARSLNGDAFTLAPDRLDLLAHACEHHAGGELSEQPTVAVCWDADRLDIGRYGYSIDPELLSTGTGRELARSGEAEPAPPLGDVLAAYADARHARREAG